MDLCDNCHAFARYISSAIHNPETRGARLLPRSHNLAHVAQNFQRCRLCNHIYYQSNAWNGQPHLLARTQPWIYWSQLHGPQVSELEIGATASNGKDKGYIRIAIWADKGSPAASSGGVSTCPPLRTDRDHAAFSLYNTWLHTCRRGHEKCRETMSGRTIDEDIGPELPTRVLDLGDGADRDLVLLETHGLHANYCALSYCWGPQGLQKLLTTRETLRDHLSGISFDALPRMFQDAVQVVRSIGIRYLWIDSLCILQGDGEDWESESKRMATVYSGAYLVIAASGSRNPEEGCFVSRLNEAPPLELPFFSANGQDAGTMFVSLYSNCTDEETFQTWGPLGQRGWAMQEWYLARRILHFMPAGPIWACAEMGFSDRTDWVSNRDILTWTEILEQYSWRKFTWVSDRLIALDGLATAYRCLTGDSTYERGIFLSQLPQTLLWAMVDISPDSERWEEQPSWHWASKGGHKRFRTEGSVKSWREPIPEGNDTVQAVRETITIDDSGALKLQGQMKRVHTRQSRRIRRAFFASLIGAAPPDDSSDDEDESAYCSNCLEPLTGSHEGLEVVQGQEDGISCCSRCLKMLTGSDQAYGTPHVNGDQRPRPSFGEEPNVGHNCSSSIGCLRDDCIGLNGNPVDDQDVFVPILKRLPALGTILQDFSTRRPRPMWETSARQPPRFLGAAFIDRKTIDSEVNFLPITASPAACKETRQRWDSDRVSDWARDWHSIGAAKSAIAEASELDGLVSYLSTYLCYETEYIPALNIDLTESQKISFGLLLEPVPGREQTYKRVGMGVIAERIDEPHSESQCKNITII